MGADPLTAGIALGAVTGAFSTVQASQRNSALKDAAKAEKAINDAAARDRRELTARRLQELEGSIRASSAGRGVAGSASTAALSLSAFESASSQAESIALNNLFANQAADSRAAAQSSSPLLAGISGFSSGVGMASGLNSLSG